MCNRVRGASNKRLKTEFGAIKVIDNFNEVLLDEVFDRPESSFAYDHPRLPVLTSLNPDRWELMTMAYLPREANGNPPLQHKLANLHNARAESIFEKFAFRNSILQRRCIIPLEGFYDFQGRGKRKGKEENQCYYIDFKDGSLFYAAGVWDVCDGEAGFAIITTDANPLMREIHNKNPRQPHHIDRKDWERWLNPLSEPEIRDMLQVYPDDNMQAREYELPKPPAREFPQSDFAPTLF